MFLLVLALFSKFEIFKTFLNNKINNFCLWRYFFTSIVQKKNFCSHAKISQFFACEQEFFFLNDWSRKIASKAKIAVSNFENSAKMIKNIKNPYKNSKKTFNFFLFRRFYTGRKNFNYKKSLFYAKFFEFEEFSIVPFFCSSIQPQHTVKFE